MAEITNINVPPKKEPVTIEVSTAAASGDGPLTAEAFNEQEENFEVKVEQVEDGKYKLTFPPPCPAEYTLSIKWGEETLPDTPLKLNLNKTDSKAVKISQPPGGNIRPGEKITIGFDTSKAGRGMLTSTCFAEDTGDIPVEIERKGFSSDYLVNFLPPHEDMYTLHVKWAGKNVKGSPFHIDMIPVLPTKVTSHIVEPEEPGGKIEVHVCTKGAGNAKLKVTCKGEKVGLLPVEEKKQSPNDYQFIAATASEPDKYTFDITFAGHQIPSSPIVVDMVPKLLKKVTSNFVVPKEAGGKIELQVCTKGAGNANLEATCKGDTVGILTVERNEIPPHDCHFIVTTPSEPADRYTFEVTFGGHPIPGSPFTASLSPSGLGAAGVKHLETCLPDSQGSPVSLTFDSSKAGEGALQANVTGTKCRLIENNIEVLPDTDHNIKVTFVPPRADSYTVDIYWNDDTVPGSPFCVDVLDPTKLIFGDLRSAEVDVPLELNVDTCDAGPGKITASCKGKKSGDINVSIKENFAEIDGGKYIVVFRPPQYDTYTLLMFFNGEEVKQFVVNLELGASGVKHLETCLPDSQGSPVSLTFDSSKAGEGTLRARVAGTKCGHIDHNNEVLPDTDHNIRVTFVPPRADSYIVDVYWNDDTVPGSPFYVDVLDPTKIVFGELRSAEIDHPLELNVDTSNAGPGKITASCKGESSGDVNVYVEDNLAETGSEKYIVSFRPPQYDTYTLLVFFNGKEVRQFVVKIEGPPGVVKHLGTCLPDSQGSPVSLTFDSSKAGEGTLRARVTGTKSGLINHNDEVLPDTDHNIKVTFVPPRADSYIVDVYWNDVNVPGSPFYVDVLDPAKIVFGELRFAEVDVPLELNVDTSDAGPGKITASCKGKISGDVNVYVEDNLAEAGTEKYIVVFRPPQYDTYTLLVFFNGKEVRQFVVELEEPLPLESPYIFGLSSRKLFFTEEKIKFGVNAKRAGEGRLNVKIAGPAMDEDPPEVHVDSPDGEPHIYNIEYTPKAPGTHTIQLKWNDDSIPESPVIFSVEEGEGIPTFPMTKPYKVFFVTDCDPKDIQAYVTHEETAIDKDLTVGKRRNGKVKLVYNAEQPGIHTFHVLIDGSEVSGSPFRVNFIKSDPSACRLLDVPKVAYVGEESCFKIDGRKAGSGELRVRARVPTGGSGITTRHEHDSNGFFSIWFTAQIAGEHFFDISWDGETIFDSPVRIAVEQRGEDYEAAKKEAAKVHVLNEDLYIFDEALPYSLPAYICISTGHAGKGKLTLKTTGPGEANTSMIDRDNGVYTAEIRPSISGLYTLGIFWNDIHIEGSPFKLNFTKEKSYLINGLDLDSVKFLINDPYRFHLHCPHEEKRDPQEEEHDPQEKKCGLSITCTPSTAASISYTPFENDPNSYRCEIVPKEEGNHEISIKYNDCEVHNSPYYVQFDKNPDSVEESDDHLAPLDISIDISTPISSQEPPSSDPVPSKVRAYGTGLGDGLVIGQEGFFTIETENAGDGKLEVDVYGPKGAFKVNIRRHPDNIRTLLARYDPKVVGDYTIGILWDGKHIPQSPFSVHISDQSKIELTQVDTTIEL